MNREIFLIVGLGNIGDEYAHTRHNAGFDALERLENRLGLQLRRKLLLRGLTGEITDGEKKIVLCKPATFMNSSEDCVEKLVRWYDVPLDHLLVIYDDIDLPPGRVRVRKSGGPGTHNGMRDIVERLGSESFPRIRIGTGDRPKGQDLVTWVLGHAAPEERKVMEEAFDCAANCALDWVRNGIDSAMRTAASAKSPSAL